MNGCIEAQSKIYAIFEIGLYYLRKKSKNVALFFIEKAADKGHQAARYHMGIMARDGIGMPCNLDQAYTYFESVERFSQFYGKAQFELAWFNWRRNDPRVSTLCFSEAFHKGVKEAFYFLGLKALEEKDLDFAQHLFTQASAHQVFEAARMLAQMQGDDKKNADKKRELLRTAAEGGVAEAQFKLSYLVEGNAARNLLQKAADGGFAEAQYILSCRFEDEQDYAQMMKYLQQSAALGYEAAMEKLEGLYHRGRHVPKDVEKAEEWKRKREWIAELKKKEWSGRNLEIVRHLAMRGCGHSALTMAHHYSVGYKVEQNKEEALSWLKKATAFGHKGAKAWLAQMLWQGDAGERDLFQAQELLQGRS